MQEDQALSQLDPKYKTLTRLVAGLIALPVLVAALAFDFHLPFPSGVIAAPIAALIALFVFGLPKRRYAALGFALGSDRLRVVRGVMFHADTIVPFGRVQHLDVHQGPLERLFGLATLILHTAGTHGASVSLPGLPRDEAIVMREEIRAHIKREAA